MRSLALEALDHCRSRGASYADVRIARFLDEGLYTREEKVQGVNASESFGAGVRVLVAGAWGFAATPDLSKESLLRAVDRAIAVARANRVLLQKPVELAPAPKVLDAWQTPMQKDPFRIPVERKIELLLAANRAALGVKGISFVNSSLAFFKQEKLYVSTDGSIIDQTLVRTGLDLTVTAVDKEKGEFESRSTQWPNLAAGFEHVEAARLPDEAPRLAEQALVKLSAASVEPGSMDLVILPSNLWLTIHESIGHSTELDRALGYEADFAGTSFYTPDQMGKLRVGSDLVNITCDRTTPGGLATIGYDDDGIPGQRWPLVKKGVLVDYQTTRDQAAWIGRKESTGCSYADSWASVPFQRMPNVGLDPVKGGPSVEELAAGVKRGVLVTGRGSWSIDHQRKNFQFTADFFNEIKDGKVGRPLKDVAYRSSTTYFWGKCDAVGRPEDVEIHGSLYDGKGQPMQVNAVSHPAPPARFRAIDVLNTKRDKG